MAQTYYSRLLAILRELEERMTELFGDLATFSTAQILRAADADGLIPMSALLDLRDRINARMGAVFLGRSREGGFAPFDILANGRVNPLADYSRILFDSIEEAERLQVEQHANIMMRRLQGSDDVIAALHRAQDDPFVSPFKPNPLARYDPAHLWVDKNGRQLSDRIWRTSNFTRRKLDLFLEESIAEGHGARAIASDLETFLKPGRALKRTNKPYGTDASYDAMRLARTEIARAAAEAGEVAANMNPFVEEIEIVLSGSHPKVDICDEAAAASPFPKDDIPDQYRLPMHPHDLCHYRYVMAQNTEEVLTSLREDIRSRRKTLTDAIGPIQTDRFTQLLMQEARVPA